MFRLQVLESVDSTNEVIKRAIEDGEPEGLAIRAYRQTGGYGRQGRAWKSPRGGMYESILLRPEVEMRELPTLALVVAIAVRRALASLVVDDQARRICIKWPNDVVLAGTLGPITRPVTPPLSLADIRRAQTVLLWRTAHWAVLVVRNCARRTPVKLKGSRRRRQTPQALRISTPSSPASPRRSMRVGYAWESA